MHSQTGILTCLLAILLSIAELSKGSNSSSPEEAPLDVTTTVRNSEHSVKISTASYLTKLTTSSIEDNSAFPTHIHNTWSGHSLISSWEDELLLPSQTMSLDLEATTTTVSSREKGAQRDPPESSASSNSPPDDAQVTVATSTSEADEFTSNENEISLSITTIEMSVRSSKVIVVELAGETEGLKTSGISATVMDSSKTDSVDISPTPVSNEKSTVLEMVPRDATPDSSFLVVRSSETSHSLSGTTLTYFLKVLKSKVET